MVTEAEKQAMLEQLGITPKIIPSEQLAQMFSIFKATGHLFQGSIASMLFGHILALQNTNNLYEFLLAGAPVNQISVEQLHEVCKEVSIEEEKSTLTSSCE